MLTGGLAAGIVAAIWSAVLCVWDLRARRLPDALTLPAGFIALGWAVTHPVGWWGMAWPLIYLAIGRGVGGGDVKLALPLGVAVAGVTGGVVGVLVAMALASALTLVHAFVVRERAVAHGPSMIAAAWMCCAGAFVH
ncbi:prepilin peptidase [Corynebacterium sp. LK2510]|uniref:prepilin peptidase n=1 Tax=Corynebacterium sp. LK2510 TaxID=3110472 RepID=UPI0034CD1F8A